MKYLVDFRNESGLHYHTWWNNFVYAYDPLYEEMRAESWCDFCDSLGYFKYYDDGRKYILEFETEEDMINFLIKWS